MYTRSCRSLPRFPFVLFCLLAGIAALCIPSVAHGQTTEIQAVNPPSLPSGHGYSQVIIAPPGRMVYISGQQAVDSTGAIVGEGNFRAQCEQVFENIGRALRSAGLTFENVVRLDVYMTTFDYLQFWDGCRSQYISSEHPPTTTLHQIKALDEPELMLEIAAVAVLPYTMGESGKQ